MTIKELREFLIKVDTKYDECDVSTYVPGFEKVGGMSSEVKHANLIAWNKNFTELVMCPMGSHLPKKALKNCIVWSE